MKKIDGCLCLALQKTFTIYVNPEQLRVYTNNIKWAQYQPETEFGFFGLNFPLCCFVVQLKIAQNKTINDAPSLKMVKTNMRIY